MKNEATEKLADEFNFSQRQMDQLFEMCGFSVSTLRSLCVKLASNMKLEVPNNRDDVDFILNNY